MKGSSKTASPCLKPASSVEFVEVAAQAQSQRFFAETHVVSLTSAALECRRRRWTSAQVEDIESAAGSATAERPVEESILRLEVDVARLESDVANLRTHMADVKAEIRALRDKMDAMTERFDEKLKRSGGASAQSRTARGER